MYSTNDFYLDRDIRAKVIPKTVLSAILGKGVAMAVLLWAVLSSHLSVFEKGLIIAAVSAGITGFFTYFAAVRAAKLTIEGSRKLHDDVKAVKKSMGLSRREDDVSD